MAIRDEIRFVFRVLQPILQSGNGGADFKVVLVA
jgi:hypothetical protein